MKEQLKNSLQILSDNVDGLSDAFSFYKENLESKFQEKLDFYRLRDANNQDQIVILKNKITELEDSLSLEKDKNMRVKEEIKALKIDLKNKLNII